MKSTIFNKHLRNSEIAFDLCTKYGGYYRFISGEVFNEDFPTMTISLKNDSFFLSKLNSTENQFEIRFSLFLNKTDHIMCTFLKSELKSNKQAMIRVENSDPAYFSDDLIGGIIVITQDHEKNWIGIVLELEDDIERFQSFFNLRFSDIDGVIDAL
ncbi:hypothetical protein [Methanospirillum purgamenti]|uniref:Uncharacterized protein n=1 Tax=Methanospirillum hungatei TaxID=2203 RepID=A0A8F5VMX6_METHU|nr:hypothetical protein [Methanospirillum hungatei]QXO94245.1 hypothetical protein KSK55_13045 [Methanospirillum hungatei]